MTSPRCAATTKVGGVDALLAAGYGVTGNGEIAYEDMLITGDFVWQLVSGDTLLQVSA